jgi:hypothetical protein
MPAIRNLFTFNDVLTAVSGSSLISLDSAGARTTLATIGSAGGPAYMEQNLTQLCINDGAQLYVWDGFSLTTESGYAFGDGLAFVDQRIVFPLRGGQSFQCTGLGDARSIDPLDNFAAEGSPDKLVTVLANLRELLVLGTQTAEIWHSVGGDTIFERSQSEYLQVGCAAPRSAVVVSDTPVWLGRDRNGQAQVMGGRGIRLSTRAQEEKFEGLDLSEAQAFTFTWGPFLLYCLNVPNIDTTLTYDLSFKQWVDLAEMVNGEWEQWRPTCHAFAYGRHFFGAADGTIYRADGELNAYGSDPKVRSRICPTVSKPSGGRVKHRRAELICEKGNAAVAQIRWKDSPQEAWRPWLYMGTGELGAYRTRVEKHRLGSADDRIYEIRMSDDVAFNPISFDVEVS